MTESKEKSHIQDPIEEKLAIRAQEVKEAMERIEELDEIRYVPGFEDRIGFFPNLESLPESPLKARFSYGEDAPNMSSEYGQDASTGEKNVGEFLETQGFINSPNVIKVLGKYEGTHAQVEEVDFDTPKDRPEISGNFVFTRDSNITLIIKPADCPVAIVYCKDKEGNPLVAICHAGRDAIDAGLIRQGFWDLQDKLGVDLSEAKIGVFPGISQKNYFITNEPERRGSSISERNWGEFITQKETDDLSEKRHVDMLSAFEMQALQAGVRPENIQAYRVDVYEDAAAGKAYSRRYSGEHDGDRLGGQVVAVQLTTEEQFH
ncbi:MAG: hypothetical protein A3A80_01720 [Candidatus Terrybacteria bacterium RIFCSPLOWO2_01_FULL_44_24]|uniref:Uncharacterized protein n=1 Tax=Candidatus Terrybacteria bacterium RIFCSPHIGHO2_01_FULL_43_35 TaxID=1802361 RepID=A0A1G2PFP6_9BACT|nr:MAG: hypothetical protein A2828_04100 [Candidatus Terrybacteria bacterium RIFCSPHIGHO2_01_FULL_43_35]OHA51791.1 MAG: hypothetical protein A3A80_01720 [Candidatus Terrybacteria bacterium RIFCSPLOWO2_01_FULL_44_24]